mmetsp:Transcript_64312/g.114274  ORF Transcript_64312/g.114274 Transcript_64312/m.114274 type:complete len:609 (-) Transcript_64312:224-2050(-)
MPAPMAELLKPTQFDVKGAMEDLIIAHRRITAGFQELLAENVALRAAVKDPCSDGKVPIIDTVRQQRIDLASKDLNLNLVAPIMPVADGPRFISDSQGSCSGQVLGTTISLKSTASESCPTVDCSKEVSSVFTSRARHLNVMDSSSATVEFFAHEGILRKLPYFNARSDWWGLRDAEKLYLPLCCSHSSFDAVLCRLYSLDTHWSPADWIRVLGSSLQEVYGALLLVKMLLADDLFSEILAVVRQLVSDAPSVAWMQHAVDNLYIPELDGFREGTDPVAFDAETLKHAALNAMHGSVAGRELLEAMLAEREQKGLAVKDAAALIAALQDHGRYLTRSCTYSTNTVRNGRAAVVRSIGPYRVRACDFFKPFRIPTDGFDWLWQLIKERVEEEPELFQSALAVFKNLQWVEYDVNANRHGQESSAGSRRLRHLPEAASKQAIRRGFSSLVLLGLRLLDRGHLCSDTFLTAFSCGTLSSSPAPEDLTRRCRNILHFQPSTQSHCPNYVDCMDVVAIVMSSVDDDLRMSILSLVPNFADWQWAFTPQAVRALSAEQQTFCVQSCTLKWLTGEVCAELRGEASSAARARLAPFVGSLGTEQQKFMWIGLGSAQ